MTETQDELLIAAANEHASCIISLPSSPVASIRRSKLLHIDESVVSLLLEKADCPLVEQLIAESLPVHVTIRSDNADILFHSLPVAIDLTFLTTDKRVVTALQLKLPEKFSTSQRRRVFRIPVTPEDGLIVKLWRVNDYVLIRDRPLPSQELPCDPMNLGEGGLGALVRASSHQALNLKFNQRFRTEIRFGKHEILLEARLRHPEQTHRDDDSAVCGFEFMHNERDVESRRHRQKLQLVLSELQRAAFRRMSA